jgi:hypothetical protein
MSQTEVPNRRARVRRDPTCHGFEAPRVSQTVPLGKHEPGSACACRAGVQYRRRIRTRHGEQFVAWAKEGYDLVILRRVGAVEGRHHAIAVGRQRLAVPPSAHTLRRLSAQFGDWINNGDLSVGFVRHKFPPF